MNRVLQEQLEKTKAVLRQINSDKIRDIIAFHKEHIRIAEEVLKERKS